MLEEGDWTDIACVRQPNIGKSILLVIDTQTYGTGYQRGGKPESCVHFPPI